MSKSNQPIGVIPYDLGLSVTRYMEALKEVEGAQGKNLRPDDYYYDKAWKALNMDAELKKRGFVKNSDGYLAKVSNTACRVPKSGGDKIMANQNSVQGKIDYYSKRVNNPKLSERQRQFAARRLKDLCGGNKKRNNKSNQSKYTDAQRQSYNAGVAYGLAKTGREMNVSPENQASFKNGVKAGRSGKYAKKK